MPFSHAYMMSQHYIGEIELLKKNLKRRNNVDILDWLENQKGAEHRIAADEIKLLRTKAIPEGYVPLPIKLPYDQTRQVIVEYFAKSSNGECFLFDEFWEAMIEAALKPQKATL